MIYKALNEFNLRLTETIIHVRHCDIRLCSKNPLEAVSIIIDNYKKGFTQHKSASVLNPYEITAASTKTILRLSDLNTGKQLFKHSWHNL